MFHHDRFRSVTASIQVQVSDPRAFSFSLSSSLDVRPWRMQPENPVKDEGDFPGRVITGGSDAFDKASGGGLGWTCGPTSRPVTSSI